METVLPNTNALAEYVGYFAVRLLETAAAVDDPRNNAECMSALRSYLLAVMLHKADYYGHETHGPIASILRANDYNLIFNEGLAIAAIELDAPALEEQYMTDNDWRTAACIIVDNLVSVDETFDPRRMTGLSILEGLAEGSVRHNAGEEVFG